MKEYDEVIMKIAIDGENPNYPEKDRYYWYKLMTSIRGCDNGKTCFCKEE
jgi:hypothetical protein